MKDMNFQIDRAHGVPAMMGESRPLTVAHIRVEVKSNGDKKKPTDFQREKHDSCK